MDDKDRMGEPSWWSEVDEPVFGGEEGRSAAKVVAARQVLGYLLNLPYGAAEAARVRTWLEPLDFPGVLQAVALRLWDGTYDGDVQSLVLRMLGDGYGGRIRNGVVVTDMYWEASLAAVERAAFVMRSIRRVEKEFAEHAAQVERLTGR